MTGITKDHKDHSDILEENQCQPLLKKSFHSFDKVGTVALDSKSWNTYKVSADNKNFPNLGKVFQIEDKVHLIYVLYNRNVTKTNYQPEEVLLDITNEFISCYPGRYDGVNFHDIGDSKLQETNDCLSKKFEYLSFARLFVEE